MNSKAQHKHIGTPLWHHTTVGWLMRRVPNPAEAAKWTLVNAVKGTKTKESSSPTPSSPGTMSGGWQEGTLLFSLPNVPFNPPASSLLATPKAASQAYDTTGTPQCRHATEGLACGFDRPEDTHVRSLSLKGSHRNASVPPRQPGRRTGSVWIAVRSPAKLRQSVPSPWREILHHLSSRGSWGAHGCVRASRGQAEATLRWPTFA